VKSFRDAGFRDARFVPGPRAGPRGRTEHHAQDDHDPAVGDEVRLTLRARGAFQGPRLLCAFARSHRILPGTAQTRPGPTQRTDRRAPADAGIFLAPLRETAIVMSSSGMISSIGILALCGALLSGCGPPADDLAGQPDPQDPQRAFFENMRAMCGETFGGRTIFAEEGDETFEPARLYFTVEECGEDEIRAPFTVGDDASRTWILQMGEEGLTFSHEHLRPDGTEYETSGFGGHATDDGSATFQHFPDFWGTDETPEAERRIWRLRIDQENDLFVYYLDRGGRLAYRLVFHLGPPSPAPR